MKTMEKIKVFNQFNPPIGEPNPVGDGLVPVYDYVEDKDTGEIVYKEIAKSNLYELIQRSKNGTDIHYIVDRMSKGDNSLLNVRQGIFADVSEMPKDVFELGEMSKTIKAVYEQDKLLQSMYKDFETYQDAFIKGEVFDAYVNAAKAAEEAAKAAVVEEGGKVNEAQSK